MAGVFDFHHFHSTSHGRSPSSRAAPRSSSRAAGPGLRGRGRRRARPARGTGHRRATDRNGFTVVGAYPPGQEDYDLLRGDDPAEVEAARERIAALGPPPQDPVGGRASQAGRRVGGPYELIDARATTRGRGRYNRGCSAPRGPLLNPVPGPRRPRPRLRRRVVPHLPAVLRTAAAAVAAWFLAVLLLPSERPAFASIAAVICIGITYGKRRWRALELVGGVVLGISISSVLLYLIGTGPIQIALLVILAMTAALLFRGGELLVNEAAISAILLASLQTHGRRVLGRPHPRGADRRRRRALIASLLLPPDPVAMIAASRGPLIGKLGARSRKQPRRFGGSDVAHADRRSGRARGRRRRRHAQGSPYHRQRHSAPFPEAAQRPRRSVQLRARGAAARTRRPQQRIPRPPGASPRPHQRGHTRLAAEDDETSWPRRCRSSAYMRGVAAGGRRLRRARASAPARRTTTLTEHGPWPLSARDSSSRYR